MRSTQVPQYVDPQTYRTGATSMPLQRSGASVPVATSAAPPPIPANVEVYKMGGATPLVESVPSVSTNFVGQYRNVVVPPSLQTYGAMPVPTASTIATSHVLEVRGSSLLTRCTCEFLGTLVLFLVVVLCPNAFFTAAFYVALIYAFWFISGAHLNPAISFAFALARRMPVGAFVAYVFAQIAGGLSGGILFHYILSGAKPEVTVVPASPYTLADACVIETLYTTMLVFVALNVMCSQRNDNNQFYGIALGFVVVAGGYIAEVVLGGALFNPAFCLGLMSASFKIGSLCWYILAEIISAILAVLLFKLCRFRDERVDHDILGEIEKGPRSPSLARSAMHMDDLAYSFLGSRLCCEFLGTFWLVITIILNTAMATGYAALSGAGVLISLIYALGEVSGGHFNPAVTLAVMWSGRNKCSGKAAAWYIFAQLLSSILAGILASEIFHVTGLFDLTSSYGWFSICFAEFLFTLMLTYLVLVVTTSETPSSCVSSSRPNFYYALAIGFVFLGGSYAIGNISGGYLNPAVALGFTVDAVDIHSTASVSGWPQYMNVVVRIFSVIGKGILYFANVLVYWIPEIFGAGVAALLFRNTHSSGFYTKMIY